MVRSEASHEGIRKLVAAARAPLVVDAEALHAVAGRFDVLRGKRFVLTPHAGEFRTLAGEDLAGLDLEERKARVRGLAKRAGGVVLLKGALDVVSDGARVHVDEAGSPYLTKGGYGDAMAGVVGALLARRADPFDAACAGAFILGTAGARAAARKGEGTLASEAVEEIPTAIRDAT
jgi:NAD(P)H-hydrate epimerase